MSLSQDEIDKLMNGAADQKDIVNWPKKVLEQFGVNLVEAIENIIPVLIGAEDTSVVANEPTKKLFNDFVGSQPDDNSYYIFTELALTTTVFLGIIDKVLGLEISQKMMGQEGAEELNEGLISALQEAFNNVLGAFDTTLKNEYKNDEIEHGDLKILEDSSGDTLKAEAGFAGDTEVWWIPLLVKVDGIDGKLGLVLSTQGLEELVAKHPDKIEADKAAAATEAQAPAEAAAGAQADQADIDAMIASGAGQEGESAGGELIPPPGASEIPGQEHDIQVARFEELQHHAPTGDSRGVDLILDVPLSITVELGRKTLSVREILDLTPGSLVELEKLAGEAVDLLVNGKLFARGEVVVIDENFGVRVSAIVTPKERLERLSQQG